jgi:PASTA domain
MTARCASATNPVAPGAASDIPPTKTHVRAEPSPSLPPARVTIAAICPSVSLRRSYPPDIRRLAATITLAILAVAVLAGCGPTLITPNVVGLSLDKAHQAFEALGIKEFDDKDAFENRNAMVDSNWAVLGQDPAAGTTVGTDTKITLTIGKIGEDRTTARLTEGSPVLAKIRAEAAAQKADAERKATAEKAAAAKAAADKAAAAKAAAAKAVADKAAYEGPPYKIVTVDRNQSSAKLSQYWVYTSKFDYSTDAYKDQVKMIIADIARKEKTAKLFVEDVTNKEIAEAESPSTYESFVEEHGMDYAINTIPQKEKSDWIASYTGGFDLGAGEPSESAAAFEVIWFPAGTDEIEKWKPQAGPS